MMVLIVESDPDLGQLWAGHLRRQGNDASVCVDADAAIALMRYLRPDVIVANLDLPLGGAMAVSDYAAYRYPDARVVFVTASSFFSDGSIFNLSSNACAFLPARTTPEDLAAVIEFHGRRGETAS